MGSITLARHGEPALSRKVRLTSAEYRDWWARYELGGLKEAQTPPARLLATAREVHVILASTRRRAVETAQALAIDRVFVQDNDLIEAPLPPPALPKWIKLSPRKWGVIARIWWFFNHHHGEETQAEAKKRADLVAAALIERAETGDDILVLAHGFFNLMIGRSLKRRGWRCTSDGGYQYWSARRFEKRDARFPATLNRSPKPPSRHP
jgi:broad specificity phosphatase PhoE